MATLVPASPFVEDSGGRDANVESRVESSSFLDDQLHQQQLQDQQQPQLHPGGAGGEEDEEEAQQADAVAATNDQFPNYGLVSFIGRRKDMEDATTVISDLLSLPCDISRHVDHLSSHHFFGVYDGHGGSQVASFCQTRLHQALVEQLQESITLAGFSAPEEVTSWDPVWERAMESCFVRVDGEIDSMCLRPGNCDKCEGNAGVCSETVGSTAVVAVVGCCRIVIANCGDSRVVLSRGGRALPLSTDHKPEREDEMQRIEEAGGNVFFWNGYRVMGMLAMSRAIGDRYLDRLVIPNPDVLCVRRSEEDEFLVLASDGLWDVLSNEQVCDVTRMCLAGKCNSNVDALAPYMHGTPNTQARLAAAFLTKLAYNRRSGDNISVVVVDLRSGEIASASSEPSPPPPPSPSPSPSPAAGTTGTKATGEALAQDQTPSPS